MVSYTDKEPRRDAVQHPAEALYFVKTEKERKSVQGKTAIQCFHIEVDDLLLAGETEVIADRTLSRCRMPAFLMMTPKAMVLQTCILPSSTLILRKG